MSTPFSASAVEPVLPKGDAFYDAIMAQIEPELTSTQLPLLEQRSAADTPEQKAERQARYTAAFEEFDRRAATELSTLEQQVHAYKHASQKDMELASRTKEAADVAALESSILAA